MSDTLGAMREDINARLDALSAVLTELLALDRRIAAEVLRCLEAEDTLHDALTELESSETPAAPRHTLAVLLTQHGGSKTDER